MSCRSKSTPIEPLLGLLDTRSLPADVGFSSWRWRQNFAAVTINKMCRRFGWARLMYQETPQNHDLHDQLLQWLTYYSEAVPPSATSSQVQTYPSLECGLSAQLRVQVRQPPTLLFEAVSTAGARRLIAGTQNRLYVQRASKGNWQVIADAYGGVPQTGLPERRFKAAQVNDAVLFTNNFDEVLYWSFDQPIQGCDMQGVSPVPTLSDIGLTTAAVIYAWKGIIFLGDVEMDAERVRHRVVWSGLSRPLSWIPGADTIAGFQDLDYGERILRFLELGDFMLIYTTLGIWRVSYVGGEQVFQFTRVYFSDNGDMCLAYPNTLVSVGDSHLYLSRDGIYNFNQFLPYPERPKWIHAASGYLFSNINTRVCEAHIGHYDPILDEVWFSWVKTGASFPAWTLALNVGEDSKSADYIDHGFTAMATFNADRRPDVDAFVLENCFCTEDDLLALDEDGSLQSAKKEGVNCTPLSPFTCEFDPTTPVWTTETMDLDGRTIENYFAESPSVGSLCSFLETINLDELCRECDEKPPLVLASATDWCLKEYTDVGYRERCTVFTNCGTYVQDPYTSILTSGPIRGKTSEDELKLSRVGIQFEADPSVDPNSIILSVGLSGTPTDPNNPGCPIRWRELSSRSLECASIKTAKQHEAAGTTPFKTDGWQMLFQGRNLYLKFEIRGTGGLACFSQIAPDIEGRLLSPNA